MKSIHELEVIRQAALEKIGIGSDLKITRIVVGMSACGISTGAKSVLMALLGEVQKRRLKDVIVTQTGCLGICPLEPIVEVYREGDRKTTYVEMTAEKARQIFLQHILNGNVVYQYTIRQLQNVKN